LCSGIREREQEEVPAHLAKLFIGVHWGRHFGKMALTKAAEPGFSHLLLLLFLMMLAASADASKPSFSSKAAKAVCFATQPEIDDLTIVRRYTRGHIGFKTRNAGRRVATRQNWMPPRSRSTAGNDASLLSATRPTMETIQYASLDT